MKQPLHYFSIIFLISIQSFAQNKQLKTYYDAEKKQIKEIYHVLDKDSSILDGLYKTFYQNGKIKTVGFYTKNQASDYWEYRYQNGNIKMEGLINNFLHEGHWLYYYENGVKSHEGTMEKEKKNGYWRFYYEDGTLKSEGSFVDNKPEGEWKYYYDDGSKKALANFKNGMGYYSEYYNDGKLKSEGKLKDGKGDSTWTYYHPNGNLKAKGKELNGLRDGEWTFYFESGNVSSIGFYNKGETSGFWRYFYENGKISSEGKEKQGQKEGQWNMFYDSGKPKGEGNFKDGNGEYTEYFDNGKPKLKGHFKKGIHDGNWIYYYDDGIKEGECNYFNGEGWYTGFYKDGSKKMEGFLNAGNKIGVWKLYKEDGSIAGYYKTYYEDNDAKPAELTTKNNIDSTKKNIPPKPGYTKKSNKTLWARINKFYRPNSLIYRSFILSGEPINIALGNAPMCIEYYYQEKWGLEASGIYFRKPMFTSKDNQLNRDAIFSEGLGYAIKYKKYIRGIEFIGLPYFAGEYLYSFQKYFASSSNEIGNSIYSINQNNYQFSAVLGNRFMKYYDQAGFTFDLYIALGLGYKTETRNYSDKSFDSLFQVAIPNFNPIFIPFRFGLSIGYAF